MVARLLSYSRLSKTQQVAGHGNPTSRATRTGRSDDVARVPHATPAIPPTGSAAAPAAFLWHRVHARSGRLAAALARLRRRLRLLAPRRRPLRDPRGRYRAARLAVPGIPVSAHRREHGLDLGARAALWKRHSVHRQGAARLRISSSDTPGSSKNGLSVTTDARRPNGFDVKRPISRRTSQGSTSENAESGRTTSKRAVRG